MTTGDNITMSEQQELPPGTLTHIGVYKNFEVHRASDGMYIAYQAKGREGDARPKVNGKPDIWNGKSLSTIILLADTWDGVCKELDERGKRPKAPRENDQTLDLFK